MNSVLNNIPNDGNSYVYLRDKTHYKTRHQVDIHVEGFVVDLVPLLNILMDGLSYEKGKLRLSASLV